MTRSKVKRKKSILRNDVLFVQRGWRWCCACVCDVLARVTWWRANVGGVGSILASVACEHGWRANACSVGGVGGVLKWIVSFLGFRIWLSFKYARVAHGSE